MMQKEEKIVVVLLVMAVLSLIIAYFGFSSGIGVYSTDSKLGERVYVEGTVLDIKETRTGGNLILTLSNLNIKVFVSKEDGAKEVYDALKAGDRVKITGRVSEYDKTREILVENPKDIIRL